MARNTKSITRGHKGGQSSGSSKRPPLTHFLCIPLVTDTSKLQLEASLLQFQESVSTKFLDGLPANNTPREFGTPPRAPLISPKAIRPSGTIHFTLGVMSLENENKLQEAVDYLESLNLSNMAKEMNLGTTHMNETGMLYVLRTNCQEGLSVALRELAYISRKCIQCFWHCHNNKDCQIIAFTLDLNASY
jgi:activating signal cointegrator complex subunit 1